MTGKIPLPSPENQPDPNKYGNMDRAIKRAVDKDEYTREALNDFINQTMNENYINQLNDVLMKGQTNIVVNPVPRQGGKTTTSSSSANGVPVVHGLGVPPTPSPTVAPTQPKPKKKALEIHRYWAGSRQYLPPYSIQFGKAAESFGTLHNWTDKTLPSECLAWVERHIEKVPDDTPTRRLKHRSNLVRLWLLYEYGGLWIDHDVLLLRQPTPAADNKPWIACTRDNRLCSAAMMFPKRNDPLLALAMGKVHNATTATAASGEKLLAHTWMRHTRMIETKELPMDMNGRINLNIAPWAIHLWHETTVNRPRRRVAPPVPAPKDEPQDFADQNGIELGHINIANGLVRVCVYGSDYVIGPIGEGSAAGEALARIFAKRVFVGTGLPPKVTQGTDGTYFHITQDVWDRLRNYMNDHVPNPFVPTPANAAPPRGGMAYWVTPRMFDQKWFANPA